MLNPVGTIKGIWIGDSSLFRLNSGRQYLFGLSAYVESPLQLPPSMLKDEELKTQLLKGCLPNEVRVEKGDQDEIEADKSVRKYLRENIDDWLDKYQDKGIVKVLSLIKDDDLEYFVSATRPFCRTHPPRFTDTNDLWILSECATVGVDFVVTQNYRSIDHGRLNSWFKKQGKTSDFIGDTLTLSEMVLQDVDESIDIVAAMAVSNKPRSIAEDFRNVRLMVENMAYAGWDGLGSRLIGILDHLSNHDTVHLIESARKLSQSGPFQYARKMNADLVMFKRDALALWNNP